MKDMIFPGPRSWDENLWACLKKARPKSEKIIGKYHILEIQNGGILQFYFYEY
jgi:hypothetical protein